MQKPESRERCAEFVGALAAFVDDGLEVSRWLRLDAHLETCRPCTAYFANYRTTVDLAKAAWEDGMDAPVAENFVRSVLEAAKDARGRDLPGA